MPEDKASGFCDAYMEYAENLKKNGKTGTPVIAIYLDPTSLYGYRLEIDGKRIDDVRRFSIDIEFPRSICSCGTDTGAPSRSWERPHYELELYMPNPVI